MRHNKLVGYEDCIVKLAVNTDWSLTGVPDEEVGSYSTQIVYLLKIKIISFYESLSLNYHFLYRFAHRSTQCINQLLI